MTDEIQVCQPAEVEWLSEAEYFAEWRELCEVALLIKIPPDALEGIEILLLAGAIMRDAEFDRRGMPQDGETTARGPLEIAKEMQRAEKVALRHRLCALGAL